MKTAILFELHHLGDAVLSVPFVRSAQDCKLHVVCRKGSAEIFRMLLPSGQIHIWDPIWEVVGIRKKLGSVFQCLSLRKYLRSLRADFTLCVWADSRVHQLMKLIGVKQRFGFPVNQQNFYAHELPWRRRRMRFGQVLGWFFPLSHPLQRRGYQQSHLEDWRQLTEAAGGTWNAATPWFEVAPDPEVHNFRLPGKKLWLIHPGGRLTTKRWPLERFQQLLTTHFSGTPVLLVTPPDSPGLVSVEPLHHPVEAANLSELLALIQSADAVLCNDSLVSHLAAALGKPVWSIFGSGNPNWFAPYQNADRVIASNICPFRPCIDRCLQSSTICLEGVSVEQVASRLKSPL